MPSGLGDELLWLCPSLGDDDEDLTGLNTPSLSGSLASVAETGHGATRAYSLNGSTQAITIPHHSRFNFGTGDFAVSMHVKPTTSGNADLLHKIASSGTFAGFTCQRFNQFSRMWLYNSGGASAAGKAFAANVWSHVVFQRSEGFFQQWLNGERVGDDENARNVDNTVDLKIGSLAAGGWGGGWFTGLIDDIRVFNRSITPAERIILATPATQDSVPVVSGGIPVGRIISGGV